MTKCNPLMKVSKWSWTVRRARLVCCQNLLTSILLDAKQARIAAKEAALIIHHTTNDIDEIKCSCLPTNLAAACCSVLSLLTGNQLKQLLRTWLSPADPSTNQNIARKAHHNGTAVWLFQGRIFTEWKATGSLLWIHGKRAFLLLFFPRNNRLRLL